MSIYNDIRAVLEDYLADTSPTLPVIAPQNVLFEPTPGTSYLKTTLVPTLRRPAVRGLNPQLRYDGLFSILICTPQGFGSGAGYDLADQILDRFAPVTDIAYTSHPGHGVGHTGPTSSLIVSIEYSEVGTSYLDPPYYCTPVTVAWYTYK